MSVPARHLTGTGRDQAPSVQAGAAGHPVTWDAARLRIALAPVATASGASWSPGDDGWRWAAREATLAAVAPLRSAFAALWHEIAPCGWAVEYERPVECSGLVHYEPRGPSEHAAAVDSNVRATLDALRASGHDRGPATTLVEPVVP